MSDKIENFRQLCVAVQAQLVDSEHSWMCHGKDASRSVILLQHEQYVSQKNFFSSKSYHRLQLIQIASFAIELFASAATEVRDDHNFVNDVLELTQLKNELVGKLLDWRQKTIGKMNQSRGIVKIVQRVWYWLFDPEKKLNYLSSLKDVDVVHLKHFCSVRMGFEALAYPLELQLGWFRHPLLCLKVRRMRREMDESESCSLQKADALLHTCIRMYRESKIQINGATLDACQISLSGWEERLERIQPAAT